MLSHMVNRRSVISCNNQGVCIGHQVNSKLYSTIQNNAELDNHKALRIWDALLRNPKTCFNYQGEGGAATWHECGVAS